MGVVTRNAISQLMAAAAQQVPSAFVDDSVRSMRIIDLKDLVPVIVLVTAISPTGKRDPMKSAGNGSGVQSTETSQIFKLLEKGMELPRSKSSENDLKFGEVNVNFSSMEVNRKGKPVQLTAMEFKAMKYLVQNTRRVISRDELVNEVWGYENYPCTRTVDNHIFRLRQKLEKDPSRPIHFLTVHGAGYKFLP
jgi:two-component system, OmpR family, alkaline phosphatase synthesis response regulator PhoP